MSMHIEGPWLSTTGKKKGKKKFASSDAKRKAQELEASWNELLKKYPPAASAKKPSKAEVWKPEPLKHRTSGQRPASLNGGVDTGAAVLKPSPKYTGTKIKGIGTMHKSNAVPIFSDEDAIAIATMRR